MATTTVIFGFVLLVFATLLALALGGLMWAAVTGLVAMVRDLFDLPSGHDDPQLPEPTTARTTALTPPATPLTTSSSDALWHSMQGTSPSKWRRRTAKP